QGDSRGGDAIVRRRQARRVRRQIVAAPFGHIHDFDRDRALRTGLHAGGSHAIAQAVMAHVALSDDSAFGVVLRHSVRTVPNAILTADARIGAVQNNAGLRILGICLHRTPDHAGGLYAVIAAHREVIALRVRIMPALKFAYTPPVQRGGIAVLLIASDNAA